MYDEKKTETIRIRVTKSEKDKLQQLASNKRISMSEVVRLLMFDKKGLTDKASIHDIKRLRVYQESLKVSKDYTRATKSLGNNLNQIAKYVNTCNGFNDKAMDRFNNLVDKLLTNERLLKERFDKIWQSLR